MGFVSEFFTASAVPEGGAVLYALREDGELTELRTIPMPSPDWTEIADGRIAAAIRDPEAGEAYAEYSLASGRLLRGPVPSRGVSFCHFARDGEDVYCANYTTGSVLHIHGEETALREHRPGEDGVLGPNAGRQERPHCHQCLFSPCRRFVLVCDLGLDRVVVYDRALNPVSRASVPAGHGARHGAFSPDGRTLYVLSEMASSLTVFDWDGENGVLSPRGTVSFAPSLEETRGEHGNTPFTGLTDAASIAVSGDGRHIWCSSRGEANTIAHLTAEDDGSVVLRSQVPSGGNHPRAIGLLAGGRFLAVCNTFSNNLTMFRVGRDGELTAVSSRSVPRPQCVNEV